METSSVLSTLDMIPLGNFTDCKSIFRLGTHIILDLTAKLYLLSQIFVPWFRVESGCLRRAVKALVFSDSVHTKKFNRTVSNHTFQSRGLEYAP
jgi:hypothetical protein